MSATLEQLKQELPPAAEMFFENLEAFVALPEGVVKLRELILDLAVRGKLVEQDEDDEPAAELAEKIKLEQIELIAATGMRKPKALPSIDPQVIPFGLPHGWVWVRLGEIGDTNIGLTYSPKDVAPIGIPVLRASNIRNGRIDLTELVRVTIEPKPRVLVNKGDLLICARSGSSALVGKVALINKLEEKTAFGAFMALFRSRLNDYLYHFICSRVFRRVITDVTTTTINQITQGNLRQTLVPLPPLAEQKRIVAKVDALMQLCDQLDSQNANRVQLREQANRSSLHFLTASRSQQELSTAWHRLQNQFEVLYDTPETLADLEKAIVSLASRGLLVPQDDCDQPVHQLLQVNREERRKHWEERELQKMRGQGTNPRSDRWKQKYKEPCSTGTDDLPPLPGSWAWERIEVLGEDPLCPVQTGPFGSQLLKTEFVPKGVPVIAVGNLTGTGFKTEKLYHINENKAEQLSRYRVDAGDLLFARTGSVGRACIAPNFVNDWRMTGHILRVRLNRDIVDPYLMVHFLWASTAVRSQIVDNIRGMTRPGYNTSLLESIRLPIPPLAEQKRIVAKVDSLLAKCDQLSEHLEYRQATTSQLLSAVIHGILEPSTEQ